MAYQSNGIDVTNGLVPKSYLLDIYPSLSNVVTTPSLWVWGRNNLGQLGDNTIDPKSSPIQTVAGGTNWKQVACGYVHSAVIKTDGTLWVFGRNDYGRLGDNTVVHKSSPVQTVAGGTNWAQVSCGVNNTVAVKTDGTLWTWGYNYFGTLGNNTSSGDLSSPVQTITGGTNWCSATVGNNHVAAIKTDGSLWCWGVNDLGQLGDNTVAHKSSPVQTIASGTNWKQVFGGYGQVAAIKTDGTLWMWGKNTNGQLGDNTVTPRSSPVQTIAGGTNWKQVTCGYSHTAAIKTDGTLWCWGNNGNGQLGDTTTVIKSSPIQVYGGGTNWRYVASSTYSYSTLAIKSDGTLWGWGYNSFGQLGDNTTVQKSSPVQTITGGTNWKQVSTSLHTLAIADNDALGDARNPITSISLSGTQTVTAGSSYVYTAIINYLAGPSSTDCTKLAWSTNGSGTTGSSTVLDVAAGGVTVVADAEGTDTIIAQDYISSVTDARNLTIGPAYGYVRGWGYNAVGNLGDNSTIHRSSPVQTIAAGSNWKQISSGLMHTVSIKADGTLWGWGANDSGQLGYNTTDTKSSPVQTIAGGTNWQTVSCGNTFTTAIKTDGTLWGWGDNYYGQLGDNTRVHKSSPVQTIAGGTNWKQTASGHSHTAAIKTDGTLWMCGYNVWGQLGDNTRTKQSSPIQTIAGGSNWKYISCKFHNTTAVKTDGTLWVWGHNTAGQLGDNTSDPKSSPVQTVAGGTNWRVVACGYYHTSAIKTDGTLWLWGSNDSGQLGDNTKVSKSSPVQTISGGNSWRYVASYRQFTSAIKTDGTLWSWGDNTYGELGDNTTVHKSSPVQTIAGGNNWLQVSSGFYYTAAIAGQSSPYITNVAITGTTATTMLSSYTYTAVMTYNNGTTSTDCSQLSWTTGKTGKTGASAVTAVTPSSVTVSADLDGTDSINAIVPVSGLSGSLNITTTNSITASLWGCGYNLVGELGDNTRTGRSSPVQTITGGTNWKYIACGNYTACGIKSDGSLWLWGSGSNGQFGDNSPTNKSSPVQTISGGTNWKRVASGNMHTAAIKTDGTLWTWGFGSNGQLGDGTAVDKSSPVQTIAGGTNWKYVACGREHTVALKTDGTLWGWGRDGYGQLGDNTNVNKSSPVQTIAGGTDWKILSAGGYSTAAIKTDGTLWVWGRNYYGGLGINSTNNQSSPVQTTTGGTNWMAVSCGYGQTAAIKTDGTLWMWGNNGGGQLGDNTTADKSSPVQTIAGGTNWKQVACGEFHTTAIKTDGTLWTWGTNNHGQLCDNTTNYRSSPVQTIVGGTNWKRSCAGTYNTILLSQ